MGLSSHHNSPPGRSRAATYERITLAADTDRPQPEMRLAVGGSLLQVTAAKRPRPEAANYKRGKITSFTPAARKRLMRLLGSINRRAVRHMPILVTLTYPAEWPHDPTVWKDHLDAWLKRLARAFPGAAAIWKMEYQKRGAPHFHLLIFGLQYLPFKWVGRSWYEVVGSGEAKHLAAGCRTEVVKSWRGVMSYASKYLGKVVVGGQVAWPGRFWGVMNRVSLPVEWLAFPLGFQQFYRVRRLLLTWERATWRRSCAIGSNKHPPWRKRPPGEWQGLTLWGEASALLQLLKLAS